MQSLFEAQRQRSAGGAAVRWSEVLNSDASLYGGSNQGNLGGVTADDYKVHGQPFSAQFTLPPLGVVAFKADS